MKKSTCKLISLFMLLMSIYFAAGDSYALDAPHNIIKTVACSNCHDASGTASPWRSQPTGTPYIDNTYANNLCTSCHYATNIDPRFTNSKYKNVETHSSYQTNGTNSGSNAWVMDCRTCHNAHYQAQVTSYPTSTVVSFVTGTDSYTNATTLTVGNTLTAATYTNWIIVPNTAYPTMMYRITGNTANTVNVDPAMPINAGLFLPTGSSKTYVIRYPNMVKNQITTPNSGVMNVRFFNNSGPGSFATSSTSVDGVCQVCHDTTLSFNNTGTLEGGLTRGGSHPTGKAGTNCTTCHTHDTGFKGGGCDACHGYPPVVNSQNSSTITNGLANNEGGTGSTTAGAHNKHVNSASLVCNDCHMGGMPSSTIYDKKIQIGFGVGTVNPTAVPGTYYSRTTLSNGYAYIAGNATTTLTPNNSLTCAVYCHSTVQPNGGGAGAPVYTSVTWTATGTVVCGSCHATTAGTPRGLISTGSHTPHLSSTLMTTIQCEDCHTGAGAGTSYTAPNHINYSIEVADGYTATAGGAPGNGYGTCATASCHGNKGTPNWSRVSAANIDPCTKCHGTPTIGSQGTTSFHIAPPNDIAGSSTGSAVGAHQKHLQSTAYSVPMACAECHNVPTAANFTSASHLAPGATELSFSTTPTNSLAITGGATPTYNYGTQTCSTVYCHDSTFFKYNWGVGSNPTPTWNNANYLSGTAAQKCGTCHGYPPDTSTGKHPSPGTDCQGCHQHVNATNDGFKTAFAPSTGGVELHVDGQVEGGGCDSCHGNPPVNAQYSPSSPSTGLVGLAYNNGDTGATNNNPASPGAHDKHTNALTGSHMTCDACHTGSVMSDHKIQMGFAVSNTTYPGFIGSVNTGTFTGYNSLKNTYSFAVNPGTNLTLTNNYANANSCAVYCHGSTMPNNGGTVSVPTWTNASSGACNACHGASAATPPTLGAHAKHAGSMNLNLSCDKCHGATVETTHVDGSVAWSLATGDPRFSSSATYSNAASGSSGRLAPSATYGSCAVYCHSNASPLSGTTITVPTAWSSTITNCGACHSKFDDASPTWSAPHTKHIKSYTNFTCATCHTNTASSNSAVVSGLSNTFHVNAVKDVKFNSFAYTSATYTTATGCQNTYCHSTGQNPGTPTHAPFTWSGTMLAGCVGCHGGDQTTSSKLASGSHFAHINSTTNIGRNIGCTECHNATVISNQTLSNLAIHVDKNVNIKFDNVTNKNAEGPAYETVSTITPTGAAIMAGTPGACSNLYCHSSGNLDAPTGGSIVISAGVPSFKAPTWGGSNLACDGCHGDQLGKSWPTYGTGPAGSTTANSHVKHVDTVTGSGLSCDYCHVKTTISTTVTANTMTLVTGATTSHLNRVEDVFFKLNGGMTGTYNPTVTSKTCAATYCHGGGNPKWGDAALGCNACHQSQGADGTASYSGAHNKHANTAGYDFSCEACHAVAGTTHAGGPDTGTNPGGGPVGAYQTVEMSYTALSAGTMTTGQKYRGSASTYKYTSIASNPFGAATTPAFSAGTTTSADANNSAITFYTNGSCNSIWCHSNANPAGGANVYSSPAPTWGATLNCGSCHSQATDASPTWSGPHNKHIKSYSTNALMSCSSCHQGTVSTGNTTLVTGSTSSHVNAKKDVLYNSTIATTGTYTAGQGCQNTYCHSNGTKLTAPYVTAATTSWQQGTVNCGSCHGSGALNGVPSYTSGGANKANSHVAHVTTQNYACVDCHSNTVDVTNTITNVVTHVNRTYDVAGARISLYTQSSSTGGTCTNTCHGTGTTITQWGKNWPGNDACTKCHGTLTSGSTGSVMTLASGSYPWAPQAYLSAPSPTPNNSGLFTDLSATRVGTHQQHLTTNPYRLPIACQECHVVPATPVSGSHMSGPTATVTFPPALSSYLANTHEGALAPNAAYASATCSTNYCHDSSYFKNGRNNLADIWSNVAGTVPQPLWNNTLMLTQTSPTTADCNKCHGYPPGGTHPSPVADCDSCHPHVATGSVGFKALGTPGIELHMDGKVEGGGCNGCHAYDVVGATYTGGVWSGGTWTHSIARDGIGQGWGAHAVHINHIKTKLNMTGTLNTSGTFGQGEAANVCGTCHTNINDAPHHTTGGSITGRQITFGDGTYKYGGASGFDFRFVTGATPTYYGASGTSSSVSPKTCSNVSCHFSNSPVWSAY